MLDKYEYYRTDSGVLYCGDCFEVLKAMPDQSVSCCVTSPPYWGLRDYGVDGQLGLEKTPEEYVVKMVEIFREVRRVLKDNGTLWLNLGDSYNSGSGGYDDKYQGAFTGRKDKVDNILKHNRIDKSLKPKDLVGIPWRVAIALQADGWYLRQDIIWHKPNPMPESVKDRCTKAHEYIFLMSKSPKYYYDADAIREPHKELSIKRDEAGYNAAFKGRHTMPGENRPNSTDHNGFNNPNGANKRSVWTVATKPFSQAHFATFPPKLIEPCILAGCPKGGVVLDPFMGAGTTAIVSYNHNRNFVGIELSEDYLKKITTPRIIKVRSQLKMF